MKTKHTNPEKVQASSGITVSLKELIDLRYRALENAISVKKKTVALAGQRLTTIRGQGIDFDSTREYQSGDDIRHMAWRVTARSLKPYIKVYTQEKERPVWLAVDLSPSLFFGTRCMFKSVCSIKQAALLGWSYLLKREKIGAVIATSATTMVYKPQTNERDYLAILQALSTHSHNQPDYSENNQLSALLTQLQPQLRSNNLVFILSDFFNFDIANQQLILQVAQRAQVVLVFIYDPFEAEAPSPYQYLVTDGRERALFNMNNAQTRQAYQQQFQDKLANIIAFSRNHNINLEILRTNQEKE